MKKDLLHKLADDAGIMYLSDLHNQIYFDTLYYVLGAVSPDDYSKEEWDEAVVYILGQGYKFTSSNDAYRFLKKELWSLYSKA